MVETRDWQGRVGQEWAKRVDGLDQMLDPFGEKGMAALGDLSGKRVLDVGCGAGSSTRSLSAMGADVTGVDVSDDLLTIAKERGDQCYLLADAAADSLGGPYDAVYSRFGAMFFDDPVAGWGHIRHEAGTNAKLSIVAWCDATENSWATLPMMAAKPYLSDEKSQMLPSRAPGPFAWADSTYFGPILMNAGWKDVQWSEVEQMSVLTAGNDPDPIERAVLFLLRIGVLASRLGDEPDTVVSNVKDALREVLQDFLDGDAVRVPAKSWIITGKA